LLWITRHFPPTRDIRAFITRFAGSLLLPRRNRLSFSASFKMPIVGQPTTIAFFENELASGTEEQEVNSRTANKTAGRNKKFIAALMDSVFTTLYSG
jgi:hypothetical protein